MGIHITDHMHPFCFTLPYGMLLIVGGIMGFLNGSKVSLVMGGGCGILMCLCGHRSLQAFRAGKSYTPETITSLAISTLVAGAMAHRYQKTGAIVPAGGVAAFSVVLSAFLVLRLASPVPPKKIEALR